MDNCNIDIISPLGFERLSSEAPSKGARPDENNNDNNRAQILEFDCLNFNLLMNLIINGF